MYQGLHIDVLEAMASGLTDQLKQGQITLSQYEQETSPIVAEICVRVRAMMTDHDSRLNALESNIRQEVEDLRQEQTESYRSHDIVISIYDAFLETKGLADEFEEFEHEWMLKRGQEGAGPDGPQ